MTVARTWGIALTGIDGALVEVEADVSPHVPSFSIIGLPDKALGEAQQRVRNATENCGMPLPDRRLTVNLSPASLPKQGSGFDVAIAIASLATSGGMDASSVARTVHIGELGLDGRLRPVRGVLPAVLAAVRAGMPRVIVPHASVREAQLVAGAEVIGATTLADVAIAHGSEVEPLDLAPVLAESSAVEPAAVPDLSDVVGQDDAIGALLLAAAGGHNMLLSGPPGVGKTMLAERLPSILPPLDDDAALEVAAIRSLSGAGVDSLSRVPPFEAPHHSATMAALVGGGSRVIGPGAIARASNGVLFLDEAAEFGSQALDSLRQPLEKGHITIHRAGATAQFPARFQLVLATNPCPCGNYGSSEAVCSCAPNTVRRYLGKLSGPLMDRIDIQFGVRRMSHAPAGRGAIDSASARARVAEARLRAADRWGRSALNAAVPGSVVRSPRFLPPPGVRAPLDRALERGVLSLRGYDRTLRLAWTLSDLAGVDRPGLDEIGGALFHRKGMAL